MSVYSVDFHDLEDSEIDLVIGHLDLQLSEHLFTLARKAKTITCTSKGSKTFRRLAKEQVDGHKWNPYLEKADAAIKGQGGLNSPPCVDYLNVKQVIGLLREQYKSAAPRNIVVHGAISSSLEQAIPTLDLLYQFDDLRLFLIGQGLVYCLLKPGINEVRICHHICTRRCGLLPFRPITAISSQGLKRSFDVKELVFGNLVGASNEVSNRAAELQLSDAIVWYSTLS